MNMTVIVASAVFTSFGFLALIGKCSNKWLKRVLGYEYFLDIIMSLGMMFYFGLTGSITGIIVSAITGCIFSLCLYSAKHTIGHSKVERVNGKLTWVDYEGDWTMDGAGSWFGNLCRKVGGGVKSFFGGLRAKKHDINSIEMA